jgi:hypothetical protein
MSVSRHVVIGVLAAAASGLLLFSACDEGPDDDEEMDDQLTTDGHCAAQPGSCDDLVTGDGELASECCFAEMRYWCKNGLLHHLACTAGCIYVSADGTISCDQLPEHEGGGEGSGHNHGSGKPKTDPGPGPGF